MNPTGRKKLLFLGIYLVPIVISGLGFPLLRYLHKREVKHYILEHLPESELVRLAFSKSASNENLPEWEEEHEFFWKEQEYDVVKTIESKDSTIYYAWCDEQEALMDELIRKEMDGNPKNKNSLSDKLSKWIALVEKKSRQALFPIFFEYKDPHLAYLEEGVHNEKAPPPKWNNMA